MSVGQGRLSKAAMVMMISRVVVGSGKILGSFLRIYILRPVS